MGHYASEMMGERDIEADKEHMKRMHDQELDLINFRWNELYPEYERTGVYSSPREELTCPKCFSRVPILFRKDHNEWHRLEYTRNLIGPGLFG